MIVYAVVTFAVAALGGVILSASVLRNRFAPWSISLLHAGLGATGLILLIVILQSGDYPQQVLISFFVLVLAALGGFYLASFHSRKTVPPKLIVSLHAIAAIAGFLILASTLL